MTRPFLIAGGAGYYLCFVRRKLRSFYPFLFVFLPGAIGLIAITMVGLSWFGGPEGQVSILEKATDNAYPWRLDIFKDVAMGLGPGYWIAAFGLALVAVFFVLLYLELATLPISLPAVDVPFRSDPVEDDDQRRTMLFVWMVISLIPLVSFVASIPATIVSVASMKLLTSHVAGMVWANRLAFNGTFFLLISWGMGTNRKQTLRRCFHFASIKLLGISILIPAAISAIWPMGHYIYDRIYWAAYAFGMQDAPQLASYLTFPLVASLWHVIPALIEEIAWRGFLQPRFVNWYGLARGVFFVGIVWGAFHFAGDFHLQMTASAVVVAIFDRFCITVAHSYVLAWLTIRSRSILPAALTHAFYNIFLQMPIHTPFLVVVFLWAILAWILFRYFPPKVIDEGVASEPGPTSEPAI
jgi:membrane protease YdiL (CAAX protease family)